MFDFLRNLRKSDEEKRREQLNAYLDDELSPAERTVLEHELSRNMSLRVEMEQLRQVKRGVQELPRVRAPRNYTLDPAVYGAPARQPAWQFYPALRTATALAAFLLILAIGLDLVVPSGFVSNPPLASFGRGAADVQEVASEEVPVSGEAVSVTTAATELAEGVVVTEEVEMAPEAAEMAPPSGGGGVAEPEEPAAIEAPAEESAAEEAAADSALPSATAPSPSVAARATSEALAESAAATLPAPAGDEEETLRSVPEPTATDMSAAPAEAPEAEAETETVTQPTSVLVFVEIALGVALVLFLAATLYLRSRLS